MEIYSLLTQSRQKGNKLFAVLIDPDKIKINKLEKIIELCNKAKIDFIFIGGSLLTNNIFDKCISTIKKNSAIPVVIFPGSIIQINDKADAILFLSLISGRNADMLIGKHVMVAPLLKKSNIEIIPTGYMLIESGKLTSVTYMSNTQPIPYDKENIAISTALAGEMLGLKTIFMDAGSGAFNPVSHKMIKSVSNVINVPLIVGGGINTPEKACDNCRAGADVIVVGNAIESSASLIDEISQAIHEIK
ncbi:MAG: Heptaprenylglyceryl phosphate synthase [Bacteroidetes bacterium ADurb.Bin408]|nr:MAG: Heptaprenylglyceryl phosphate synthase [Bacteroidetes bacterium ADurb.Bin408]